MNGAGTLAAALFGSCFPTTIYIGHPGWKGLGARSGYSILNAIFFVIVALLGLTSVIEAVVPIEAGMAIVLWIGMAIVAVPVLEGWQWVTLTSPVFVAFLLIKVSGIPMLEESADERWGGQDDYEEQLLAFYGELDPVAPYTDQQSIVDNLGGLLQREKTEVKVVFGEPIKVTDQSRKAVAEQARAVIASTLQGPQMRPLDDCVVCIDSG